MCACYLLQLPHIFLTFFLLAYARFLKNHFCLLDIKLSLYISLIIIIHLTLWTPSLPRALSPQHSHTHTHKTHTHTHTHTHFNVFFPSFDDRSSVGSHSNSFANSDFPQIHLVSTLFAIELKPVSLLTEDSEEWEG